VHGRRGRAWRGKSRPGTPRQARLVTAWQDAATQGMAGKAGVARRG